VIRGDWLYETETGGTIVFALGRPQSVTVTVRDSATIGDIEDPLRWFVANVSDMDDRETDEVLHTLRSGAEEAHQRIRSSAEVPRPFRLDALWQQIDADRLWEGQLVPSYPFAVGDWRLHLRVDIKEAVYVHDEAFDRDLIQVNAADAVHVRIGQMEKGLEGLVEQRVARFYHAFDLGDPPVELDVREENTCTIF
jgi:hypothetical protein